MDFVWRTEREFPDLVYLFCENGPSPTTRGRNLLGASVLLLAYHLGCLSSNQVEGVDILLATLRR